MQLAQAPNKAQKPSSVRPFELEKVLHMNLRLIIDQILIVHEAAVDLGVEAGSLRNHNGVFAHAELRVGDVLTRVWHLCAARKH